MSGQPFDRAVTSAWLGDPEVAAALAFDAELAAMLRVEAALAAAEAEHGLIPAAAAAAIARACDRFAPDLETLGRGMRRDGVVAPALVAQLRAAVGEPHAGHVHFGATSQDIVDTALVLRLAPLLDGFERRLEGIVAALDRLEAAHGARPLMAYTRMRAALPITVADRVGGWRAPLRHGIGALAPLRARLLVVQLGGPVGTLGRLGPQRPAVRASMAAGLGLGDPCASWHVGDRRFADLGNWLAAVTGALGKIGVDLGLMAQDGIGAVALQGGGSSSMPHKVNPVDAELLVALARHVAALLGGLHQATLHEYERSGAAWTLEWLTLPPMLASTGAALDACTRLLASITRIGDDPDGAAEA